MITDVTSIEIEQWKFFIHSNFSIIIVPIIINRLMSGCLRTQRNLYTELSYIFIDLFENEFCHILVTK